MLNILINIISLCIMLASVETLHGIVRAAILVPRVGKKKALEISIITGSLLAFAVCYFMVPSVGLTRLMPLLALGFTLALFMASFDALLGRLLLKRPWRKIAQDFNPTTGNYLLYGLLFLVITPVLVMQTRF